MDDLAYYGQLLVKTGTLSVYARGMLSAAEPNLRETQTYDAAVYFDTAFQIFKQIQLYACDYNIGYKNSISSAPFNYVFKHTGDNATAEAVQLQALKAEISQYSCHRMLTLEEAREALEKLGFTNVHVSEKEEYLYQAVTDEETSLGCTIRVDAFSGAAKITGSEGLAWEFANLLSVLNGEIPDLYSLVTETEDMFVYHNGESFWRIEVERLTGVMRVKNYRDVIVQEYHI